MQKRVMRCCSSNPSHHGVRSLPSAARLRSSFTLARVCDRSFAVESFQRVVRAILRGHDERHRPLAAISVAA